ncbi:hypothetical protein [Streptomyces sp. GESEQ-4]|uniref:hypothetical protein n=1 Tax=Streptomyces sp. GESEQ-4 TaxID=2812655 RepID=UPI001B329F20|nr:hypothetical protein [Streptomyces sp. GESEQ-4]
MIIIWQGWGFLALYIYGVGGGAGYLIAGSTGAWIGMTLAAIATAVVGRLLNDEWKWDWDAEHSLYGIPMQYWGIIGIACEGWIFGLHLFAS